MNRYLYKNELPKCCDVCRNVKEVKTMACRNYTCSLKLIFPTKKQTCQKQSIIYPKLFKKFLREKGVYKLYAKNLNREWCKECCGKYGKISDPYEYINYAFRWCDTMLSKTEAHNFWSDLSEEWTQIVLESRSNA